jgi:hypothetical protein
MCLPLGVKPVESPGNMPYVQSLKVIYLSIGSTLLCV